MRAMFQNSRSVGGRMRIERRWWGRGIMEVRGGIGFDFFDLVWFYGRSDLRDIDS